MRRATLSIELIRHNHEHCHPALIDDLIANHQNVHKLRRVKKHRLQYLVTAA